MEINNMEEDSNPIEAMKSMTLKDWIKTVAMAAVIFGGLILLGSMGLID